jgi:signal transduction histidine kinase/ActR/RegA family two-component response regulator
VIGRGRRRDSANQVPRRRLFRKYVLICATLVSATLLASALVQLWFTYRETSSSQGRIEREQAATAAATIMQFFTQIEPQIQLVNQTLQAGGSVSDEQRRTQYEILANQVLPITALRYLDADGKEHVFVSRLARTLVRSGADFSLDPTVAEARRTGRTAHSPVEFRSESEPYMTMVVPERGLGTGMTLAEVNLKFVGDVVTRLTTGQAGYAYVVDGRGRLIAHRDISLVLQNNDLSRLPQVQAARDRAGQLPAGPTLLGTDQEDAVVGRDPRGERVLSAHQRIDPPGWLVFVDQPLSKAYAPVYGSILRSALLLIAGLAFAVLASLELARRMVTPVRALQAGAARIGAGDLDQQIDVRTGDELQGLADEFNRMAARLRESYATLESKVEERTHELGEAIAQLEQKSSQLEVADRAKSEFLSRMSHELRTPMNAIIGFAEIMEMDPQTPPTQQEWIQHMLRAGRHLLGLINEVLDIARIEAGRLSLSLEPVAVDVVVNEALDLVRSLAAHSDVHLDVEAPAGRGAWVRADRQRLQQVLLNLLTNAIKYNQTGGRVTLRVSSEQQAMSNKDGGSPTSLVVARCTVLRITVRDTGSGIPADKIGRLFTPFDRLGAEESGIEGNGLGLAIAQRLVQAMDGAIGVESVVGEGSAFWVELPSVAAPAVAPGPAMLPELTASVNGTAHHRATVLYIEDNLSNLELMKAILAFRPGITLMSALQGTLGLTLAREHRPDLILLDLNLPDMHGDEVLARLRQDELTHAIPVAVISADATPAQLQRTLAGGARAYLTKPLDVKQLLDLLSEVLSESAGQFATNSTPPGQRPPVQVDPP